MVDKDYVVRLENVIRQMLTPLKDIPFNLVIESIPDVFLKSTLLVNQKETIFINADTIKFCLWSLCPLMSNMSLILITNGCIQGNMEQRF